MKQLIETRKTCLTFVEATTDHEERIDNNDQCVEKGCLHIASSQAEGMLEISQLLSLKGSVLFPCGSTKPDVALRVNKSDICSVSKAENGT